MGLFSDNCRRLWYRLHRRRLEQELQAEMESHRSMMQDPSRFGNSLRLRESARDAWGWTLLDRVAQDLRLAVRRMASSPGYAIAVVLTLALAIGVNTTVFSMIDGFGLRALPYPHAERIAALVVHREAEYPGSAAVQSEEDDSFDAEAWDLLKQDLHGVTLAAWGGNGGVNLSTDNGSGQFVQNVRVSADYFNVLGVAMSLGRTFTAEEDAPKGSRAVVLSYALWQTTFHGDPQIIGRSIDVKGEPHVVAGVLAANAITPVKADLFTPLRPRDKNGECQGANCGILLRLAPDMEWPQMHAMLRQVRLASFETQESRFHGHAFVYARPLQVELAGPMQDRTTVLMIAVSFVLAIACANLAGLVLVRISRRTTEIATLFALGATGMDVLRQLWIETLILALIGGGMGVGLTTLILDALQHFLPQWMIPVGGFALDLRVLGFALAASVVTSLLFGALPALQVRRIGLRSSVAVGSRSVTSRSLRWRQWLIGAEVALTVVLLAGAGLLVRTLIHLETLPPGFDPHNVLVAKVSLDDARYHNATSFRALLGKGVSALKQIPGVQSAAMSLSVPYERGLNVGWEIVDGPNPTRRAGGSLTYVTPEYFPALRIPIRSGRSFNDQDSANSLPVAVINLSFARHFFNDPSPIGRHIRQSDTTYTIVGITEDVAKKPGSSSTQPGTTGLPLNKEPVLYLPAAQTAQPLVNMAHVWFQPSWIVRTSGPIAGLSQAIQRALASADPALPVAGFYSMEDILAEQLQLQRVEVALLTTLAGIALLLSAIGVYALVSNVVVQRKREIGIRIALGSGLKRIIQEIAFSGLKAVVVGLLLGMVAAVGALQLLSAEIYGTTPNDPMTFAAVAAVLLTTAVAASLLPALRISRIEPADSLRAE